jgi:ssDNA-binding Zn-finger/Zn-ribbon topoisomerase 1
MIYKPSGGQDGKMSENQQLKDLMEKLSQVDSKLDAINGLLASQSPLDRKPVATPDSPDAENPGDRIPESLEDSDHAESSYSWTHPKNPLPPRGAITASEVETIFQRVEKINRDKEILKRVERLERQNRKITILGSLSMTFMFLVLAVFTVLMFQANLLSKGVGLLSSQGGESLTQPPAQENAAKVTEPKLAEPMKPVSDATPTEVIPLVTYVGSITSNKYHYPHCKWAAKINPQRLRTFSSVKEAQEQGYIPCPTCGPPRQDP